jgi:hypothetical protein
MDVKVQPYLGKEMSSRTKINDGESNLTIYTVYIYELGCNPSVPA